MVTESDKQNFNPEEAHPNNLIDRLSMYTETISKKIEITKDFLRGSSILLTAAALFSQWKFSENDQTAGFIFASISCASAFALILGLKIISKQQKSS